MLKWVFDTGRWSRPAGPVDWLRSSIGALLGILSTGMICHAWLGSHDGLPLLVAPIGASAVLVFAVPASPLAQPWSLLGGNALSALAGIACGLLIDNPIYAGAAAVSAAILVMRAARCLHPPGGATALTAVIGGPAIAAAGWSFALVPVALNSYLVAPETPIDELLPMLSGGIVHEALVADGHGRLAGIITQTDLLATLWRGHVAEQVAAGTKPDYAEAG